MGLFYHVLVYMGDLHLVNPAMTLSILDTDILIMVQQVSLMMFSLNTLDYHMSLLLLSTLIKIPLLEGRVMTNASALPVQRQVLEQLFITDPKVGFGQAALL